MKFKIFTLFLVIFFSCGSVFAKNLENSLDCLINSNPLSKTSIIAVKIIDRDSKKVVYHRNSSFLLKPASAMKVATSAVVLETLGRDYALKTALYEAEGRLHLKLCGDPTLTSPDLENLFKNIDLSKYDTLVVDNSAIDNEFYDDGWMWNNLVSDDNPPYSVFNLDENLISLKIIPDKKKKSVQILCNYPIVIANELCIGRHNFVKTEKRPWQNPDAVYVSGTVSCPFTIKISTPNPEKYFLHVLYKAMPNFSGKIFYGKVPSCANLLEKKETSLMDILFDQNKNSNNLSASTMFKLASGVAFGEGTMENAQKLFERFWGRDDFVIKDASGLSHKNLLSCDFLCDVLFRMSKNPDFISTLSIAGKDGTLKNRLKEVSLYGKTGTISGVSALCGYLDTPLKNNYIFVIITQNYKGSAKPAKHLEDAIVKELNKF